MNKPVVVMDENILKIAEGMGITYSEAEGEVDQVYKEQIRASLDPLLKAMIAKLIEKYR